MARMTKAEKKAKTRAKAAAKKAEAEVKAKEAETKPKPTKKVAIFRYIGKNAGRYVGKEFFPHPEHGTVMIPAAEGEKRLEVAKGGTVEITDSDVAKRLDANPKWERVK